MPEGFNDAGQFLNAKDNSFSGLESTAEVRNFEFQGIPQDSLDKVKTALSIFPKGHRPQVGERIPHYQLATITAKDDELKREHDIGAVFIPGVDGTAANNAVTASALYKELGKGRDLGFTLSMSSSVSRDTLDDPYVHSIERKAAQQASVIVEYLKNHPVKELMLMGHSLGAQELVYVAPLLERLLQEHGMDTKIGGLILFNPGGQFDRSRLKFMTTDTSTVIHYDREIDEKFPTAEILQRIREQREEAERWGNSTEVDRLNRQMDEMTAKYADPQDLPENIKHEVQRINTELDQTDDPDTISTLMKRRHEILQPVIASLLVGADTREPMGKLRKSKMNRRIGRATALRKRPITKQNPAWIRDLDTYPTAVVLGDNDPYFPTSQVSEMFRKGDFPYPKAPVFDLATVGNGSHIGVAIEPQKYAGIAVDLYGKLQQEAVQPTPKSPTGQIIPNMQIHHY